MTILRHPDPRRLVGVLHSYELDDDTWMAQILDELRCGIIATDRTHSGASEVSGDLISPMRHLYAHSRWGAFYNRLSIVPYPPSLYDALLMKDLPVSVHERGISVPDELRAPDRVADWHSLGVVEGSMAVCAGVLLASPARISPAASRWWRPLLAHLRVAVRLRQAVARGDAEVAAVLTPSGAVCQVDEGVGDDVVAGIRAAVVDRERKRPTGRRLEPAELWPALLHGRYSLADRFEADGRRWVIAYRNEAPWHAVALTPREQKVAGLLATGVSSKAIASDERLLPSSLSALIGRVLRKVGVATVAELVDLHGALNEGAAEAETAGALAILQAPEPMRSVSITPAERRTMRLVLRGYSNREIAMARGVSARTVANQVAGLLRKLGAPSRRQVGRTSVGVNPEPNK